MPWMDTQRSNLGLFRMATKTRKTLVITFVTTYGVVDGKHKSIVHSDLTVDDLFRFSDNQNADFIQQANATPKYFPVYSTDGHKALPFG